MRKPASREIISDSDELPVTGVCFLHIKLMGTYVSVEKFANNFERLPRFLLLALESVFVTPRTISLQ